MDSLKDKFYQIRLFKKEEIEIFQNVFFHKVIMENGKMVMVHIKYSSSKNIGSCTVSTRLLDDVYDVQVIDTPEYEFKSAFPVGTKITINGSIKHQLTP